MAALSFKQKIFSFCLDLLNEKINELNIALRDLKEGAENDAKSSAGDKHETARAMMQLEHDKIGNQREEFLRQKSELENIDINKKTSQVTKGSLLKTNLGFIFLAIPIGKINVDGVFVIVLSPQSPLGKKLIGLKTSEFAEINGMKYMIEELLY